MVPNQDLIDRLIDAKRSLDLKFDNLMKVYQVVPRGFRFDLFRRGDKLLSELELAIHWTNEVAETIAAAVEASKNPKP